LPASQAATRRRRTIPWGGGASQAPADSQAAKAAKGAVKDEESFPHTLGTVSVSLPEAALKAPEALKAAQAVPQDEAKALPPKAAELSGAARAGEGKRPAQQAPGMEPSLSRPRVTASQLPSSAMQPKPEAGQELPSQVELLCTPVGQPMKAEAEADLKPTVPGDVPPPATLSSSGWAPALEATNGRRVISSLLSDTPSQSKVEPKQKPEELKPEQAAEVASSSAVKEEDRDAARVQESSAVPAPVLHPTGVWLASLRPAGESEVVKVDGRELPRASWRPCLDISAASCAGAALRGQSRSADTRGGCGRRSFKQFRKAPGQQPAPQRLVVPLTPWVPAAGAPWAEVFGSQPVDSESQLPAVGM